MATAIDTKAPFSAYLAPIDSTEVGEPRPADNKLDVAGMLEKVRWSAAMRSLMENPADSR